MRRLFSNFAHGPAGLGLLLLRLVAGVSLAWPTILALAHPDGLAHRLIDIVGAGLGLLLVIGLWTPIAGGLVTLCALAECFSHPEDSWAWLLLGATGAALALLGPGAWSLDAWFFGWKRLEIGPRKGDDSPP